MIFTKKMVFSLVLLSSILAQSASSFAAPLDVRSSGTAFIKVTKNGNKRKFEYCKNQNISSCRLLGDREYKISELQDLHTKLQWTLGASSVGTTLAAACAVIGVISGGAALYGAVETFHIAGSVAATVGTIDLGGAALGATLVGGSVGGSVIAFTSKYNPVSVYERMDSVNDDVVQDRDVKVSGGDKAIKEFADTLSETLREI